MNPKNFGRFESLAVLFGLFLFTVLSLLVIFKREWLDDMIYGPLPYDEFENVFDEKPEDDERPEEIDTIPIIEVQEPSITLNIVPDGLGQGYASFDLEEDSVITGVELFLEKDGNLQLSDFVCSSPFECIFFETTEDEVSLTAIIPIGSVEKLSAGEVEIGEFSYSGRGNLYLKPDSNSFVSDIGDPEFNILDIENLTFVFN